MDELTFRGYDQAGLDLEYDNRKKVPDSAAWLERYDRDSAEARRDIPHEPDLAYGDGPFEGLDVFPARGAQRPAPVQIFIHGGYWRALYKEGSSYVARSFADHGATTVVLNYALIPSVDMDTLVNQCRAAFAWVWHNIARYGGDRERLFVSGHSAGGHLVAMLLATDWHAVDPGLPSDPIRGATAISGLFDLEPIRRSFLNHTLGLSAEQAARASPVQRLPTSRAALLLTVGAEEGAEYLRQSCALAASWSGWGLSITLEVQPGHHHFSIAGQLADAGSPLAQLIRRQMGLD